VYYMYVIRTPRRDDLMHYLNGKGIQCGVHYPIPLHLQPAYAHLKFDKGSFPVSETVAKEILSIPVYPELKEEQLTYVVDTIKQFFK
jgi:dTDP-4-amino-4,6-dideoxygalactose transaminase